MKIVAVFLLMVGMLIAGVLAICAFGIFAWFAGGLTVKICTRIDDWFESWK